LLTDFLFLLCGNYFSFFLQQRCQKSMEASMPDLEEMVGDDFDYLNSFLGDVAWLEEVDQLLAESPAAEDRVVVSSAASACLQGAVGDAPAMETPGPSSEASG
jgi:hypothetical protein